MGPATGDGAENGLGLGKGAGRGLVLGNWGGRGPAIGRQEPGGVRGDREVGQRGWKRDRWSESVFREEALFRGFGALTALCSLQACLREKAR